MENYVNELILVKRENKSINRGMFKTIEGKECFVNNVVDFHECVNCIPFDTVILVMITDIKPEYNKIQIKYGNLYISDIIKSIPTITLEDLNNLSGVKSGVITLINNIYNSDRTYHNISKNIKLTLDNLLAIEAVYDTIGVNTEEADWIVTTLPILEYLYSFKKPLLDAVNIGVDNG